MSDNLIMALILISVAIFGSVLAILVFNDIVPTRLSESKLSNLFTDDFDSLNRQCKDATGEYYSGFSGDSALGYYTCNYLDANITCGDEITDKKIIQEKIDKIIYAQNKTTVITKSGIEMIVNASDVTVDNAVNYIQTTISRDIIFNYTEYDVIQKIKHGLKLYGIVGVPHYYHIFSQDGATFSSERPDIDPNFCASFTKTDYEFMEIVR